MRRLSIRIVLCAAIFSGFSAFAAANVTSKAARETAEYVVKKFSRDAGEQGVETLAARIEKLAAAHGDDAIEAVRKVGPKALRLADDAGQQGTLAVRLLARHGDEAAQYVVGRPKALALVARYGDDTAEVLIKHKEIAEPVVEKFGASAVKALKNVDTHGAVKIARMMNEGDLAKIGRTDELLEAIGKYGNKGMDFVWRNKAALAVSAALGAFLANPQPFVDGTADLAKYTVGAVAQLPTVLATEAAKTTDWTKVTIVGIGAILALSLARTWFRHRASMKKPAS